jgi:hypothetical protein
MSTAPAPRAFRAVPLVIGAVVALIAFLVLVAGGVALWAHETQRDADGYLTSPTEVLATPTHALVSETAELSIDTPSWVLGPDRFGTIRVHAEAPHGLPIFVGIGPAEEVDAYLDGVRHDVVTDLGYGPFSVAYGRREGGAPGTAPTEVDFWAASATGTGEQLLTWRVTSGDWKLVALNPDGSAGVEAYTSFGARVAFLGTLAWTLLGIGGVLLVVAGTLIVIGARGRQAPPAVAAAPPGPPPPPATAPPAPERELVGAGSNREEGV